MDEQTNNFFGIDQKENRWDYDDHLMVIRTGFKKHSGIIYTL